MTLSFKDFLSTLVVEELHPELKAIVKAKTNKPKQALLTSKIKELSERGEKTGIEGNMPKGSSRAYMRSDTSHTIDLDGSPANIPIGTKVAIRAKLDEHHNKNEHRGLSLGALQNHAENANDEINNKYRVLKKGIDNKTFTTNKKHGIFPPLIGHDNKHHEWSQVGHAKDVTKKDFQEYTKTPSHPEGISHDEFRQSLERSHEQRQGRYHPGNEEWEKNLDKVSKHPLVKKFDHYHEHTGNPPYDYKNIENMGVFQHPDGPKYIVARDHGFSHDVAGAYRKAGIRAVGDSLGLLTKDK
ncbi:hypothetical protein M0R04_04310 [Candidatus Dojkabacteria bacterium]|jgi:hypothetical protein|nr:hypothetical protein [Candidatus Dojkabacteria bacterium]